MKRTIEGLQFKKEDRFFVLLRREINAYFESAGISKKAPRHWFVKAWSLIMLYLLTYALLLRFGSEPLILFVCYASLGLLAILLGLNVGHDAAHGTVSKNRNINNRYAFIFNLLGGNSYIWRMRHIYAHHPYPNVIGYDSDIKQSKLVRIFPKDTFRWFHKYQHIYTPLLLIFSYTLNWFLVRDFKDLFVLQYGKKKIKRHPDGTFNKMIFTKLLYLFYILFLPMLLLPSVKQVLIGFLIMNIFSGIIISVALVSTHVGEHHEFPTPNVHGNFDHSWSTHQIATTSDFCTNNKMMNFLFGGFNHHVIHHLFPEINHVHYKGITPILKQMSLEFDIGYNSEENLLRVFRSHIRLLKREGLEYGRLLQQEI